MLALQRAAVPRLALVATALMLVVASCGTDERARETINVYAASSLTEAFQELERIFEAAHPGTDVVLTFAGSQVLRLQIEHGAGADVYASANLRHMQPLVEAGLVEAPTIFAGNELVVIVPLENPAGIESFEDLGQARRLVIGTENVPAGYYAREVLGRAAEHLGARFESAVLSRVVSEEANVRLVRAKVELGEADAALVYRTDAVASDRVRSVAIPAASNVRAVYRIGVAERSHNRALARAWIELVLSPAGQATLTRHGFVAE